MSAHATMNRIFRLVWNEALGTWVAVSEIARGRGKRSIRAGLLLAPLMAALGLSLPAHAGPSDTVPAPTQLPTGGVVTAGSAEVNASTGAVLNINQSTQRASINWNTFDIGSAAQVNFNQPNSSASTLNRVLDSNPSQIFGKIMAPGQVILMNPNGIVFGRSASVDVGSLTATTHSISDADYMAGQTSYSRNGATGSVVNEGELRAALGGYIALLAPEVRNSGVIIANLGTVAMAAGEAFTLNFDTNNTLAGITVQPSAVKALVENKGAVLAPGGVIILSARALDRLQGGVVKNTGRLEATGMSMKGGRIVLEASDRIENSGSISANAGVDGSPAGSVSISAPAVVNSGAISASAPVAPVVAAASGGSISIATTSMSQSTTGTLDVSGATGGMVKVQASEDITLSGRVDATATAQGPGGSIDLSAGNNITLQDAVLDTSANAQAGQIQLAAGVRPTEQAPLNAPLAPDAPDRHPTVALLGGTQLRSESRSGRGGSVTLTGEHVGLFDSTTIDASGATGGGTVLVGGDYQGKNPDVSNASATYVGSDVSINASATENGDGGKVIVWADGYTRYEGHISALGGVAGGDGGFAEVSGKQTLAFEGTVDLKAAQGETGTLLLDPTDLTISTTNNAINGASPFVPSGAASTLAASTLALALDSADVIVTTVGSPDTGAEVGNITVASSIGWFTANKLTLTAAGAITINDSVNIQSFDGSLALNAAGNITQNTTTPGKLLIGGTTQLSSTSGSISLTSSTNQMTGAVSASAPLGGISLTNANSLALGNVSAGGAVALLTSANSGSITSSGTFAAASLSVSANGTGGVSIADINGALTITSLSGSGAMTLGNVDTGALTFDSASGNVITGIAQAGGQASGIVTLTGSSITLNDTVSTKGGNIVMTATTGDVTASSSIVTSADDNTGTASGSVTITAAQNISLQAITTTGADNSIGVGSNAAAVMLSATAGTLTVGAVDTSGGSATGTPDNRNGGNAGNIIIGAGPSVVIAGTTGARSGLITLNGNLSAIGGYYVGDAARGLGGYIEVQSPVVLTADRTVTSGDTTGNISLLNNINSDSAVTARSLTVTAGTGSVLLEGVIGGTAPLSSLAVTSSVRTDIEKSVTTSGASGVSVVSSSQIRIGDNDVTNGSGAVTINTLDGNGTVTMSSTNTYLDDAVTFTRGTGTVSFSGHLYSNTSERNDLTFNGTNGGDVSVAWGIGGGGATPVTKLGDILFETVADISVGETISAGSLVSLNGTGRVNLGQNSNYSHYYDYASGFQVATTGTHNQYSGDENIYFYGNVTNSFAGAPISVGTPNGSITGYTYADLVTNGGPVNLTAGTLITLGSYADITSAGGQVALKAGSGALALGVYTNITTGGGLLWMRGTGVTQSVTDSVLNSGSGKIRIDGGGSAVSLYGRFISSNADTDGTPAILVTNVGGSGNTTNFRSVEAQTGTFQVGLIAGDDIVAAAQTLGGAGSLTLITPELRLLTAQSIRITGSGDNSGLSFTVTGTKADGSALVEIISGANNGTVVTTGLFKTISSITTNGATASNVSVGLASNDAVAGSLSQYNNVNYSDNQIDIKTLSAATTGAIGITSTANIIDELGNFAVGSSLDVRASGRSTGMALTGDVAATAVTIMTGNGALAIGDRSITSTTGSLWLQGRGLTQGAGSVISSAGTTTIYGADYSTGTNAAVTMSGALTSASTVTIDQALAVQLGNVTIGNAGSRGQLILGTDGYYNNGSYVQYGWVNGAISQATGTQIKIGALSARQTSSSGAFTLSAADNEIGSIGYIYRGGAFSVFDKDSEANGLSITSAIDGGSTGNAVKIETLGALTYNSGNWITGAGVTLAGSSIAGNGHINAGGGDLVLQANGGNVTLTGQLNSSGAGNDIIIRRANNVQLGSYTYAGSAALDLGSLGTGEAIAASQSANNGADLTLASSSFSPGQRVSLISTAAETGRTFTVTGTDMFGRAQTETFTDVVSTATEGSKYFSSISTIAVSGANTAGNVSVGTANEKILGNVTQSGYIDSMPIIRGVVDGSVTLQSINNGFLAIGDFTVGGDFNVKSQPGTLTISGAVQSTGGNVIVQNDYFHLTVSGTGSVTANAANKGVTLKANASASGYSGYSATIQGPVVGGTGGITLASTYGSVNTSGLGTLNATGNINITSGSNYYTSTTGYATSLGAAVNANSAAIAVNAAGTFSNTSSGTLTAGGGIAINSGYNTNTSNYSTTIGGAINSNGGNSNITINSSGAFSNDSSGTLTATGSVAIKTYWDGTNERNLTLGGDVVAGLDGVKLTSSGTINQTGGVIVTTGTLSGPNSSGGTPSSTLPSARGAVTLNGDNEIGNLGPFYLYDEGQVAFSVNDVTGGLTLAGDIENSHGSVSINTKGGALSTGDYDIYAGGMVTGGNTVSLTGQGFSQGSGSIINTTGGSTGNARTGSAGGTITLTGHDGTASGVITLSGTVTTLNNTAAAITIRGTSNLQLPSINAVNGGLVLGDDTATIGLITGNITQSVGTALDITSLRVGTATNAIGGSVVLANTGNKLVELSHVNVGDVGGTQYDFDVYDSTGGLTLTQNVVSAGGLRIRTTDATTGALSLNTRDLSASGDVFLGGLSITQSTGATINADKNGGGATGGSIRIDGGGGNNTITLEGTVTTDNADATAIEIVNAKDVTLNVVSATAGTVALGVNTKALTGTVSQVATTGTLSAATLIGDLGVLDVSQANVDNLGTLTTTGALTLKEQGGLGTAGLKYVGTVTSGGTTWIETTDGVQNLDTQTLNATGQALTLKGVGLSQQSTSTIKSTTVDLYGGTGSIDLFSATNDFTGQVTVHSTGAQVSVKDANQLSMNALTGVLDPATSIKLHAGTYVSLTTENLTTTSGNIEFKSLGGILNTPGKLTTGSGNITLYSSTTLSLAEKILSTSGNIDVEAATIASRAGAGDYIETGSTGTIDIRATSGNFTQGSDVLYKTASGNISITALGGNATLANTQSTSGTLNITAGGNILQLGTTAITVGAIDAVTRKDGGASITLTEAGNDADAIRLRSLNAAGDATAAGVIQYQDADGVAVRQILTTGNATLTTHGDVTADTTGHPGTVAADLFTVKTLVDAGAGVALDQANDVNSLNIKVRNSADTAIAGENTTPTGTIRFKDSDGFVVTGIETGGTTVLTAGDAVTQTGAVTSSKLGLSGAGAYTLNLANSGTPVNAVSTFASNATGTVNFTTNLDLEIGVVNPTGITTDGAAITISAPKITVTETIDTRSSTASTAGGAVTLTTTGTGAAGNLTVANIFTSGTAATASSGNGGGSAGAVTLTAAGETLTIGGTIAARGGAGDGSGVAGADGTVKLLATAGAVTQANGSTEINAGKLLVHAMNNSSLLDVNNAIDQVAGKIDGIGQSFTYRSGSAFAIGGGEGGITGITTQGGAVDIGSDVAVTINEGVYTKGASFSASGVRSFNSAVTTISTAGNINLSAGEYKPGGALTITTTANGGAITTGTLTSAGDNAAADANGGTITLTATDGLLTVGTTTSTGAGSGTGGTMSLVGTTVYLAGALDSSSGSAAGGNIDITGPAVLSGGNRAISTGAGAGNISFSSSLNSDGSARALMLTAGTGNITLTGAVGDSVALGALTVNTAADVTASSTLAAASLTQSAGTGTTTLNGVVTLGGNLAFTVTNLTVNAATGVGGTTTISNAGLFSTAATGDITSTGGFTQNGAGLSELAGDIHTTNSNISFATPVTLKGAVAMGTDTGAGNIVFADTVDSDTTARNLTLSTGTGAATFTGAVGATHALGDLLVNSGGATTFTAAVTAATVTTDAPGTVLVNGGSVTTTGAQTYNDAMSLGNNTTLTGSTITTGGTVTGASHSLLVAGDVVFGDAAGDTVTGLTTLEVTGSTTINTDTITSADAQTYTGPVMLGSSATLTAGNDPVSFASTVNSAASQANGLTVSAGSGAVTFSGAVGGASNGALGALVVNSTGDTLFNAAVLAGSVITNAGGRTLLNGNVTTTGSQTYNDAVELQTDVLLATTNSAVTFGSTLDSKATQTDNLGITAGTGDVSFVGTVGGATDGRLGTLTITSAKDVSAAAISAEAFTQLAGSGTTTLGGSVDTNTAAGVTLTGTNLAVDAPITTTNGGVVTLNHSGTTTIAAAGDISADGAVSITATGGISTAGDISTTADDVTLASATTLTGPVAIHTGGGASKIALNGTIDGANELRLNAGTGGVNFAAAVGGTAALSLLRVESAGVITQGGSAPIKVAKLAIKSAGNVTLSNVGNDVDVLAALLSGNASLAFVDVDGVTIGTVDSSALQIVGISDGTGTSAVSLTVGGLLTQEAAAPIVLNGSLSIDTTAYDRGDVSLKNTAAAGTVLDDTLVAGDFALNSTGPVTQKPGSPEDAYLQVGGNFDLTGTGQFSSGNSSLNLIGGGSAAVSGNEIRLYGVITLSMVGTTLHADSDNGITTNSADITSAKLATGLQVVSDSGGKSLDTTGIVAGAAITLDQANSIGGTLKITTLGVYSDTGSGGVTGIRQSGALDLAAINLIVQQSSANTGSPVLGAGKLDLSDTANQFSGAVSATAVGMDSLLSASTNLDLGSVTASNLRVDTSQNVTQAANTSLRVSGLLLSNAQSVTLDNANHIVTLAANGLGGSLSLTNDQTLTVGTVSGVDGIASSGSVLLKTTTGNLALSKGISVSGASNITLASVANFSNTAGASALTVGTGHWQVWSADPALDALDGLTPNFKQYNASYGTTTVAGTGNGVLYSLAPELTVALTGTVERVYDATNVATLAQGNYSVSGRVGGDTVVLSTAGTYDDKNVANGKNIATDNLGIVSASDGSITVYGYQLAAGSTAINADIGKITPANISAVTGITASDKVYDGGQTAVLNTSSAAFTGKFSGDVLAVDTATGSFADKNANASPVTVTISGITLTGTDAGNYTLVDTTASTSALITPYAVSLSGGRAYDGTTVISTADLTLGTLVGGETLTLSGSGALATKHVGNAKTVNVSSLSLVGDGTNGAGLASNYSFTGGTQAVDITQASLAVTTSDVTKTYNGSLAAAGTAVVASGGTQLFDTDNLSGGSFAYTDANAGSGNKTVSTTGVTVNDGNGGANYSVSYVNNTSSTINKADLTVSTSNVSKTYDGTLTAVGNAVVTLGTLYNNASNAGVQDSLSGGSYAYTDANAGSGNKTVTVASVTLSDGNSGGNYNVSYADNTTSTITKASLTIGTADVSKVYDGSLSAIGTPVVLVGTLYTNASNAGLTDSLSGGTYAYTDQNAGTGKTVTVAGVTVSDGQAGGNYDVSYVSNTSSVITPRPLTVSTVVADKVYDGTVNATVNSYSLVNLVSGESLTPVYAGSASFADKTAADGKTVTITGMGLLSDTGLASNYSLASTVTGTANISKADLHVAGVVAVDKVYDGTQTASINTTVAALTGKIGADDVSVGSMTGSFADKNVGNNKAVTGSAFVLSGADAVNYNLIQPTGLQASITPRSLTVAAVGSDKVYDGLTTATVTLTDNRVANDLLDYTYTADFLDKNVGINKYIGVSGIVLTGTDADNYTSNSTAAAFANISKATLTVSAAGVNRPYDGTSNATVTLSDNRVVGDTLATSYASASFATPGTGLAKTVTVNGINVTGTDVGNYSFNTTAQTLADISGRLLTITGVLVENKVYDSTTGAILNFANYSFGAGQVLAGDNVSVGIGSGLFADKNVGISKPVTVSSITLTGADANAYVLEYPIGLTGNITPATLSGIAGVTASTKTYDGLIGATINTSSATFAGMYGGDQLVITSALGNFDNKNAGTGKTVTIGNIVLGGADAANYAEFTGTSTTTADVTQKALTVSGVTAANKTYDGTTSAGAITTNAVYSGLIAGDALGLVASGSFDTKNVGTGKTVTLVSSYNGADAGNYQITDQASTTAEISAKALTMSGITADNKVYDGGRSATVNTTGAVFDGIISGDTVTVTSTGAFADKNAATGKTVTLSSSYGGADLGNYQITDQATATADISAKALTMSGITAIGKEYDGSTTANVSTTNAVYGGLLSGDAVTVAATGSLDTKHAGTGKLINISSSYTGADVGNYAIEDQTTTTADVTQKALTVSGVTAANKTYDGTTSASAITTNAVYSGLIAGDALGLVASGSFDTKNVGTGKTVTLVSSYNGADAGNYQITDQASTTAEISAKALTMSGITADNKVYDGGTSATVNTTGAVSGGIISGDTVTVTSTGAFADKNAATGKTVTLSSSYGGADLGNYQITDQTSTSANITAKGLSVNGLAASNKVYDGNTMATVNTANSTLNGLIASDEVTVASASGNFADKNVGAAKPVSISNLLFGGADAGNYFVAEVGSPDADITPKALTVTGLTAFDKYYDGNSVAAINLTHAVFDGLVSGDDLGLRATGRFDSVGVGSAVKVYITSAYAGVDAGNYQITDQQTTEGTILSQANVTASLPPVFVAPSVSVSPPPSLLDPVIAPNSMNNGTLNGQSDSGSATSQANATTGSGSNSGSTSVSSDPSITGSANTTVTAAQGEVSVSLVRAATLSDLGVVTVTVPKLLLESGKGFGFSLPKEVLETNGAVQVTLMNGSPLPGWLSFDPQSRVFTVGTVAPGALPLQVLVKIGDQQWTCFITERK